MHRERHRFDSTRHDRGSEYARSEARTGLPTPKTSLPSSTHPSISEESKTSEVLTDLIRLSELSTKSAVLAVKREEKEEELSQAEKLGKKFSRPHKAFQSLSENIEHRIDDATRAIQCLAQEQSKIDTAKTEIMTRLAARLQNKGSSGGSASSGVDAVSREEFVEVKRELRLTQRALEDAEEKISSLSRHTVMERDLASRDLVTKEQARKICTDGNVAIERKIASIDVDISKLRDTDARINQIDASIAEMKKSHVEQADRDKNHSLAVANLNNEFTDKLNRHEKNLEQLKSSLVETQETSLQASLKKYFEDYISKVKELQTSVENIQSELRQTASAQAERAQSRGRETSSENTRFDITELEIDNMIRGIIDSEIKIQKTVLEQSEATLLEEIASLEKRLDEHERRQLEGVALNDRVSQQQLHVDKLAKSVTWHNQAIAILQHATLQQSRQPAVPSQPLTPPTTNAELSNLNAKTEMYERKQNDLENQVKHLETFVRSQQQKFDGLTTMQLAQNMVDHLRKVYPYHPANILGRLQSLEVAQKHLELFVNQHGMKLMSLDVPTITRFITDFPSCVKQASDAKSHAALLRNLLDDYKAQLANQLQESEGRLEAKIQDGHNASTAVTTSLSLRIAETAELVKRETVFGAERWTDVKKDLEDLKSLKESMLTTQLTKSPPKNALESEVEGSQPLPENWRSRSSVMTSETSEPHSSKATTEAPPNVQELDDDDEIVNPSKRIRRSNKPSMQKRHGVSTIYKR